MAKREPGATLPVVKVVGSHADLGQAMGHAQASYIRATVARAVAALHEQDISDQALRAQIEPYVVVTQRIFPQLMMELREMARAADVPFEILFRLNCYESRPPAPLVEPPPPTALDPSSASPPQQLPAKDPGVLPLANAGRAEDEVPGTAQHAALPGGCTSLCSRNPRGVVVGHTEDSTPEAVDGLYLLDATVTEPHAATGAGRSRFIGLNYGQTIPGCAATANEHGLIILIDALPDRERHLGAPRHFVSRALLDMPTVDAAIDFLRTTERGGGWNYLLVQGARVANVETTATRVVVSEVDERSTYVHSNHYLDIALAAEAGAPRPDSAARLARALELVQPAMGVPKMKQLLGDRQGFPDSICRERTIGAFIANTAPSDAVTATGSAPLPYIEACWGEPDTATWMTYSL